MDRVIKGLFLKQNYRKITDWEQRHGRVMAPGRFAQKPVPPGTQNFKRDCSHKIIGKVRSKFNLLGQFTLFDFQNERKSFAVEFSSFLNE